MKLFTTVLMLCLMSAQVWAQDPTDDAVTGAIVPAATKAEGKTMDKKFWLLAAGLNTSMLLDTKNTFEVMDRCPRCEESNPYARPFIERGPKLTYPAAFAFDAGVMYLATKMRTAKNPAIRRIWWLVPAVLTVGHTHAYFSNLNTGKQPGK